MEYKEINEITVPKWREVFKYLKGALDKNSPLEARRESFANYQKLDDEIHTEFYKETGEKFFHPYYFISMEEGAEEFFKALESLNYLTREEAESLFPVPDTIFADEVTDKFCVEGDIIITDPCYIRKYCCTAHERYTIYGDWSCTVYDGDGNDLGDFCADSGMVCVTELDGKEGREKVEEWVANHDWCATIIRGFKGEIKYIEKHCGYEWYGKWHRVAALEIEGNGTKDGKPFNFKTKQTGF